MTGVSPWDAISRWLYWGWEEVETGGQGLAGVFSGHCAHRAKQHTSQNPKQRTSKQCGNEVLLVSTALLRAIKNAPDPRLAIKAGFGISSCQIHCRLLPQYSPSMIPRASGVTDGAGR